jgi:hypothetical protein
VALKSFRRKPRYLEQLLGVCIKNCPVQIINIQEFCILAGCQCLMPVILATQEAEIRKIVV